jgi:hypothetical protein
MLPVTFAYEKEKFADILRHVEEENRRMDPMMTSPSPMPSRLFKKFSTALMQLFSFVIG